MSKKMSIKKNQHYVWRHYLQPWVVDNKIECLRNKNKLFTANPIKVASQNFFYNLNGLTAKDCELIRIIFIKPYNKSMRELLMGWVEPVERFLRILENKPVNSNIQQEKDIFMRGILEELHTKVENSGDYGLQKLQSRDISFLSIDGTESVDFILFLCTQYFRTNNMKQSVIKNLGPHASIFSNIDAAINLLVPILATPLGITLHNRIINKELHCYLVENDTDLPFITGDQPVINIFGNNKEGIETTDFELYYPVTPATALLITKEQNIDTECSIEKVKRFNELIAYHSHEQLYARSKSDLLPYKE